MFLLIGNPILSLIVFIQFLDDFFQFLEVVYLSVEELSHSLEVVPDLVQIDRVVKLCIVEIILSSRLDL